MIQGKVVVFTSPAFHYFCRLKQGKIVFKNMSHKNEPPKEYQFKKGQSGNPNGRPTNERSIKGQVYKSVSKTNKYYAYKHILEGECIYIGHGNGTRAFVKAKGSRNKLWDEATHKKKSKVKVEIVAFNLTKIEAREIEALLIKINQPQCNIVHNPLFSTSETDEIQTKDGISA